MLKEEKGILNELFELLDKYENVSKEEDRLLYGRLKAEEDYKLKPMQIQTEMYLKTIDTSIDIIKFIVPTTFTLWLAITSVKNYTINNVTLDTGFILNISIASFLLLCLLFGIRIGIVKGYVSFYKNATEKIYNIYNSQTETNLKMLKIKEKILLRETHKLKVKNNGEKE